MKLKNILYSMMLGTAALTSATSCVSDLDQYPHTETTSKDVYTSLANYEAVLGKIYTAMVTSGQGKGGDNKDMESVLNAGSGFDYMRMFWNLQICIIASITTSPSATSFSAMPMVPASRARMR